MIKATASSAEDKEWLAIISGQLDELIKILRLGDVPVIWGVADIATWLDLSEVTVKLRVITQKDFPPEFVPTGSSEASRRWFAADIVRWAKKNVGAIPRGRRKKKSTANTVI
jgi:hypothetical protein